MKLILGDNQFFGINHFDIQKGERTKELFNSDVSIIEFIHQSIEIGLDGFMINSNETGYRIIENISDSVFCEVHYSIPYPHKFATIVNENGMFELLRYLVKRSSPKRLFLALPLFLSSFDLKRIVPLIVDLELPKNLPKGSHVYLQNIVTDLLIGIKRFDLIEAFCKSVIKMGYKPGLITLNPTLLDKALESLNRNFQSDLIVCFNINNSGFNVFPSKEEVESLIFKNSIYKKMGMSVLASGGTTNFQDALNYIKKLPLDYVVFGSSRIGNVRSNYNYFKSRH